LLDGDDATTLWNDYTYSGTGAKVDSVSKVGLKAWWDMQSDALDNIAPTTDIEIIIATGGNITIDVDTATATYDNPTDADWQYKALGYNLDETSCDTTGTDPCGFKATAEINVSALGDGTQVVVLQDDYADAPQDSTEVATAATNYKSNNPDMIASEWTHTGNGNLAVDENCYGGGNTGGGWADGGFGCVGMNTGWGSSVNGNEWLIHDLGFTDRCPF
jgi:hypothetical protein